MSVCLKILIGLRVDINISIVGNVRFESWLFSLEIIICTQLASQLSYNVDKLKIIMNRKDMTYLIIKLKFNHPTQHDINCIGKNLTQNNVFIIYWENQVQSSKYQSYLGILQLEDLISLPVPQNVLQLLAFFKSITWLHLFPLPYIYNPWVSLQS